MRSPIPLALLLLLAPTLALADGAIFGGAQCDDADRAVLQWTFFENAPFGHPEWVGYDVQRKTVDPCSGFVRVNADIIPRGDGNHSRDYTDTPPSTGVAYEYQVVPVDANRNVLDFPGVLGEFYLNCPDGSAAIAHGTLQDLGWALLLVPCPESCAYFFIESYPPALHDYVGGEAVHIFGHAGCGGVEGCALQVDRFEPAACTPVPVQQTSWGSLKARYR